MSRVFGLRLDGCRTLVPLGGIFAKDTMTLKSVFFSSRAICVKILYLKSEGFASRGVLSFYSVIHSY
jgi:hypothetical protein